MFTGGELWATNEPARDRSGVCKATTQTKVKGLHRLRFDIDYLRCRFDMDYVEGICILSEYRQTSGLRGSFILR